jgi:hypothetical protein
MELNPSCPACSPLLYRLSYCGSNIKSVYFLSTFKINKVKKHVLFVWLVFASDNITKKLYQNWTELQYFLLQTAESPRPVNKQMLVRVKLVCIII